MNEELFQVFNEYFDFFKDSGSSDSTVLGSISMKAKKELYQECLKNYILAHQFNCQITYFRAIVISMIFIKVRKLHEDKVKTIFLKSHGLYQNYLPKSFNKIFDNHFFKLHQIECEMVEKSLYDSENEEGTLNLRGNDENGWHSNSWITNICDFLSDKVDSISYMLFLIMIGKIQKYGYSEHIPYVSETDLLPYIQVIE